MTTHVSVARPRVGLRVGLSTTPPGLHELHALSDHRLKIHAGPPVSGACRAHRFLYTRGDIDLQPAGTSDVWEEYAPNTSLFVSVSHALLGRAAEDMGLDPDQAGLEARHQFRDARIEHIAWALDAERRSDLQNGLLYTESLGLALAVHLLGGYRAPARGPRGLSSAQLKRVTEFIEAHVDQNLSLARLAAVASISASHLKASFKRSTGVPVHEYVIQRRVERAKALLAQAELPASRIALEAGFAHQSHMARAMRRVLGVTPGIVTRSARFATRAR